MDNRLLIDKSHHISSYLDFKISYQFKLTDDFTCNYRFKNYIYEDYMQYYNDFEWMLIVLGINWQCILVSFEMINNKTIINNRLEGFNT